MAVDASEAAALVRREALALGFQRVGFAPVAPFERHRVYEAWLARGYAGEMDYLQRNVDKRRDPRALLDSARTLVTVALSYAHPEAPDVPTDRLTGPRGRIARYARGTDYHVVLTRKLLALADRLRALLGGPIASLPC